MLKCITVKTLRLSTIQKTDDGIDTRISPLAINPNVIGEETAFQQEKTFGSWSPNCNFPTTTKCSSSSFCEPNSPLTEGFDKANDSHTQSTTHTTSRFSPPTSPQPNSPVTDEGEHDSLTQSTTHTTSRFSPPTSPQPNSPVTDEGEHGIQLIHSEMNKITSNFQIH
uniref:Uncharacterized protein n=1 Tax=Caenorhabditis tropicalis TaxID=1561998 RepID=A0A1I7TJ97_9PELO